MNAYNGMLMKRYHLRPRYQVLLCFTFCMEAFLGCLVVGLFIEIIQYFSFSAFIVWLIPLVFFVFFSYGTVLAWNSYLEITPYGIILDSGFYRIYSPWENITVIRRSHILRPSTVFVLREPAVRNISVFEGIGRRQAVIERCSFITLQIELISQSYIMNFLLYMPEKDWESENLDAYFQYYAPHLYQSRREAIGIVETR